MHKYNINEVHVNYSESRRILILIQMCPSDVVAVDVAGGQGTASRKVRASPR